MTDTHADADPGAAGRPEDDEGVRDVRGMSPGRLLALTDGVFAISMTLLALDVKFGEVPVNAAAFGDELPNFLGRFGVFFVAFGITSRFWLVNHFELQRLHRVDAGVLGRSILFLFGICAIPVGTDLLFTYGSLPAAVTFAAAVLGVTAILSARLWWYLSDPARGLADVPRDEREATMLRSVLVVFVYLLAIPLAWLLGAGAAAYATLIWFLFAVIDTVADRLHRVVRRRRERRGGQQAVAR